MGTSIRSANSLEPKGNIQQQDQQFLTFLLGGETFAIAVSGVKEIIEYPHVTAVPMMPAFIRGVINLRGSVVPVVDLSVRFGKASTENTKRTCIVIVEMQTENEVEDIGVIVDQVNAVLEIPAEDIEPPPTFGAKLRADFISGIGRLGDRFVIILNRDHVLSIEELAMVDGHTSGQSR